MTEIQDWLKDKDRRWKATKERSNNPDRVDLLIEEIEKDCEQKLTEEE